MKEEMILELHHEARKIKEHWWHKHGEPDPPPLLAVRWRDHAPCYIDFNDVTLIMQKFIARFPMVMRRMKIRAQNGIPHPVSVLYLSLAAMADGVRMPGMTAQPAKDQPIEEIWFNVEGYAQRADEMSENITDKEQDFKTNPASTVVESMTTYMVITGPLGLAEWGRATSEFHKDDGGVIVWDEPHIDTSDNPPEPGSFDTLLDVMIPHVTREKLT